MPDTPRPEPTTQASKRLRRWIGASANQDRLNRLLADIEAEAADTARTEAEKIGDEDFLAMVHERDAARAELGAKMDAVALHYGRVIRDLNSQLATLAEALRRTEWHMDSRGPSCAACGRYRDDVDDPGHAGHAPRCPVGLALANLPAAAQERLSIEEHQNQTADLLSHRMALDLLLNSPGPSSIEFARRIYDRQERLNLLDLDSPETEQRLAAALHDAIDGDFVVLDTSEQGAVKMGNWQAAEALAPRQAAALRSQAASQPADPNDDESLRAWHENQPAEPMEWEREGVRRERVHKGQPGWHEPSPDCDGYQRHVHLRNGQIVYAVNTLVAALTDPVASQPAEPVELTSQEWERLHIGQVLPAEPVE